MNYAYHASKRGIQASMDVKKHFLQARTHFGGKKDEEEAPDNKSSYLELQEGCELIQSVSDHGSLQ